MIKLFLKGGLINIVSLFFGVAINPLIIRLLSESDSKEYIRIFSVIGYIGLSVIAVNNNGVLRSRNGTGVFFEIMSLQFFLGLVAAIIAIVTSQSSGLIVGILTFFVFFNVEWYLQSRLEYPTIIKAKFLGRLLLLLSLASLHILYRNISLNFLLVLYLISVIIEQTLYWHKVNMNIIKFKFKIHKRPSSILAAVPFYLFHGQMINLYLMTEGVGSVSSSDLFYLRLGFVVISVITSMTYFTLPYFAKKDDNRGYINGIIVTIVLGVLSSIFLFILNPTIEVYYLNGNLISNSMFRLVVALLVLYPPVNYFVVNKLIVAGSQNLMIPVYLVSYIPLMFMIAGKLEFYTAFFATIMSFSFLSLILMKVYASNIFYGKFR